MLSLWEFDLVFVCVVVVKSLKISKEIGVKSLKISKEIGLGVW